MSTLPAGMIVVWFRNDLRIHDNEVLHEAAHRAATRGESLLPVYLLDPREFAFARFPPDADVPKTGGHRLRFLLESLEDLKGRLKRLGSDLIICAGHPESVIPELCERHHAHEVWYHREVTSEETAVERRLAAALENINLKTHPVWGSTLFHVDDLPFPPDELPDVFTDFRKRVEKACTLRGLFPEPQSLPPLPSDIVKESLEVDGARAAAGISPIKPPPRGVLAFRGGETAGLDRIDHYFRRGDHLRTYKKTRNGMLGADYSSKLSPWLAHGCLSPRYIHAEVRRYEKERVRNSSTYWLIFELMWRDYFRFAGLKFGDRLFSLHGFHGRRRPWNRDRDLFVAWAEGRTGVPFIDANMRELNETGYMSNRGRQNVANFLAKYLNVDWRWGAAYFESKLVDYDVCSNWGNWANNAGVGNDPRDRIFNVIAQAKRYDPEADYIRYWLPELGQVPTEALHDPHGLPNLGSDYPEPIVEIESLLSGYS